MSPSTPISDVQVQAFHRAVCERLGIDPAVVSASHFGVEINHGDDLSPVRLTAYLPTEELIEMFNGAGR